MTDKLAGISVLVTRPGHQADNLARLIESHGGEALRFPTIEIEPNADREAVTAKIGSLADYDIAIFISINAVTHGVGFVPAEGKRPLLAAVGPSTARALKEAGFPPDIKATRGFTSEALLAEPALRDVAGKKIVIFRGSGGRALLGRELEERGATVSYAEVYRRDRPDALDPVIESRLAEGSVDVVTATSAETLFNLYELAGDAGVGGLLRTQLVTMSDRVVKKAAALGFERDPLLAAGPDDQALVDAILEWRANTAQPESPTGITMTKPSVQERDSMTDRKEKPAADPAGQTAEKTVQDTVAKPASGVADQTINIATPPARRGGGVLTLLAILLSLAALTASAYLWWQQRQSVSFAEASGSAAGELIQSTRDEIAALGGRLDQNLSRVSGLDASRGRFEAAVDDLRGSVQTLTARVQSTEKSIDDVRGVSAAARNNWVRAEAEYFLQAANSRLQVARDPDAALAALQAADDRLKSLGDPTLFRVRQQLAGEIETLKSVPRPDIEGIAHTLNGLAARVDALPLNNEVPDYYESGEAVVEGEKPVDRALSAVKGVFTSMVSVKRTGDEAKPLLSRDEEFFLKRNLELQLQTARLALMRGDAAIYQETLRTARNWVQSYFVPGSAAVVSTVKTLTELEAVEIAPSLPDISESLRLLRITASTPARPEDAA